jgi:hypothetical protein
MTYETKYDVGDMVYFMRDNKINWLPIVSIDVSIREHGTDVYLVFRNHNDIVVVNEYNAYYTKAQLIEEISKQLQEEL